MDTFLKDSKTKLTTSKNEKFQDQLINLANQKIDSLDTISAIMELTGITWLDGYSDVSLDDYLPNCMEIDDADSVDQEDQYAIDHDDKKMSDYYKKAKEYLNDNFNVNDYVKPSGKFDAKVVPVDYKDLKKIVKHMTTVIKKSHFSVADYKAVQKNKNELCDLVG